jgi:hypothetical protein
MAVSTKESNANYQELIDSGVSPEFIAGQKDYWKNKINPSEKTEILNRWNINSNDVLATDNIVQTNTAPATVPDDLLDVRKSIYDELGIPKLQEQYNTLYQNYLTTEGTRDSALNQLENKTLGMNVIRGSQAEANRQYALQLGEQARGLDVAGRGLQSALTEAQAQYGIKSQEVLDRRNLIQQYAGAGITFDDDINTVQQKIASYENSQQMKQLMVQYPTANIATTDTFENASAKIKKSIEDETNRAYKETLKSQLLALGKSVKGLSKRELERKLKKANKSALEAAQQQAEQQMQMAIEQHNLQMEQTRLNIQKTRESMSGGDEIDIESLFPEENTGFGDGFYSTEQPQVSFGF